MAPIMALQWLQEELYTKKLYAKKLYTEKLYN